MLARLAEAVSVVPVFAQRCGGHKCRGQTQAGHNNTLPAVTGAINNPRLQQLGQSKQIPGHHSAS